MWRAAIGSEACVLTSLSPIWYGVGKPVIAAPNEANISSVQEHMEAHQTPFSHALLCGLRASSRAKREPPTTYARMLIIKGMRAESKK
jgi:hypothetical protein